MYAAQAFSLIAFDETGNQKKQKTGLISRLIAFLNGR